MIREESWRLAILDSHPLSFGLVVASSCGRWIQRKLLSSSVGERVWCPASDLWDCIGIYKIFFFIIIPQTMMSFGCLRSSAKKALIITLLFHGGVSHFLLCNNSGYADGVWTDVLAGWFGVFSGHKICRSMRSGFSYWLLEIFMAFLLSFLASNNKWRQTFW